MAHKNKPAKVTIELPQGQRRPWTRAGVLGAVGLILGIALPTLAGRRVGPELPGSNKSAPDSSAPVLADAPSAVVPQLAKPAGGPKPLNKQQVVVGKGEIQRCYNKGKKLDGEQCGKLRLDRSMVPRLESLVGCPAVLGLSGEMDLRFDVDFDKKQVAVNKGSKTKLPASTVNGILLCTRDFIKDLALQTLPHKHSSYRVIYSVKFYPPGTGPSEPMRAEAGADEQERSIGTVTWDTGLVRSEPRTGDVVARLVKGSRVQLLTRRKDWYRVKVGGKEGWIYRGALGL